MADQTYRKRRDQGQVFVTIREDGFVIATWLPDADRDWPGTQITSRDDQGLAELDDPEAAADYLYRRYVDTS